MSSQKNAEGRESRKAGMPYEMVCVEDYGDSWRQVWCADEALLENEDAAEPTTCSLSLSTAIPPIASGVVGVGISLLLLIRRRG